MTMHKPNHLLEFDVKDTLDWDPALDDVRIVVKADDGAVTLTGSVATYYEKVRATEDTWTVGGVKQVDNELLVGLAGEAINDVTVAAGCNDALAHDRFVPAGAVSATVDRGNVRLTGHVRRHLQRQAAEFAVSRVDGVLGIDNLIAISSEPIPGDVAERIKKAFRRNAVVGDSAIAVANDGHTVYLDGTAMSYAAMREAVDTAWAAPGVERVENRLTIVS